MRPQRLGLSKVQHTAAEIVTQVIKVGVHGVCTPPEVQVVREIYRILMGKLPSNLSTLKPVLSSMLLASACVLWTS